MKLEKYYSIRQLVERLGGDISTFAVEKWISQGRLRRTKIGRRTYVTESELQRFIAQCGDAPSKVGFGRDVTVA